MGNYIVYKTFGREYQFTTNISFSDQDDSYTAVRVYLEVANDRDYRLINLLYNKEQENNMTKDVSDDYEKITDIVFTDVISKKKLTMKYMSDLFGRYQVESIIE